MLRHEQQSIRMALATALHHSCGKVHAEYGAGGGAQGRVRGSTATEASSSPAGALPALRGRARRVAADRSGRAAGAARAGPAAHRGAACRLRSHGADSRCTCAADGGPTGGRTQALRQLGARAGYRRAQDLTGRHPAAYGPL